MQLINLSDDELTEATAALRKHLLDVSEHDRAFLENVVTDVVEIDEHARTAALFRGGTMEPSFRLSVRSSSPRMKTLYIESAKARSVTSGTFASPSRNLACQARASGSASGDPGGPSS